MTAASVAAINANRTTDAAIGTSYIPSGTSLGSFTLGPANIPKFSGELGEIYHGAAWAARTL